MIETGVVINRYGVPMLWHKPAGRTSALLPDSFDLWECLWRNRNNDLAAFAHTHPGNVEHASLEDLTTFVAIEQGLGRRLDWYIVTKDHVMLYRHVDKIFSDVGGKVSEYTASPHQRLNNITRDCYLMCDVTDVSGWRFQEWLPELRSASY
jgi:hypothetical protein